MTLSPLWASRPAAERAEWSRRCAPLLQWNAAPPPFAGATEALVELVSLARQIEGLDVSTLAGLPAQAVPARQLAMLAGRLCAEAALAAQGVALQAPIWRDPTGGPVWPSGWTGSITHAGGVAMAAVQRRRPGCDIGLDTEALISTPATQGAVLSQCVHATERLMFGHRLAPETLTLIFSAKEAYYKAARRAAGRLIDFQEMALATVDLAEGRFTLIPVAGAASELPKAEGTFRWIGQRVVTRVAIGRDPP